MDSPLVSILIPVYNRVTLVSSTIESALKQTYSNIEIIIVDNCSTDGTWDLLTKIAKVDNRIKIFRNEENIGPVRNWDRCIQEAKGEYAKILFSDDLIDNNFIEETLKLFNKKTAFVISKVLIFDGTKNNNLTKFITRNTYQSEVYLKDILIYNLNGFPVSPGCALLRTKDLKNALLIDIPNPLSIDFKKLGAGNDLSIFLNIAHHYPKIKVANTTTAFFRSHNESFSIANDLSIHYDFSKYFFIRTHCPELLSSFKASLWLKMKITKQYNPIYAIVGRQINLFYILAIIARKLNNKIIQLIAS